MRWQKLSEEHQGDLITRAANGEKVSAKPGSETCATPRGRQGNVSSPETTKQVMSRIWEPNFTA